MLLGPGALSWFIICSVDSDLPYVCNLSVEDPISQDYGNFFKAA